MPRIDIPTLLRQEAIETYFQPIVSVSREMVIGLEALSRGRGEDGTLIPPTLLFKQARLLGAEQALDQLCSREALRTFVPVARIHTGLILFINLLASSVGTGDLESENLCQLIHQFKLDPHALVVEVSEMEIDDVRQLRDAARRYKRYGFRVALDDVGKGSSNLDRIAVVEPDILKVDASLVRGIAHKPYQQTVVRSLVRLAKELGAWLIAEGVETEADVLVALDIGVDLFQGYYFAAPRRGFGIMQHRCPALPLHQTAETFRQRRLARLGHKYAQQKQRHALAHVLASTLDCETTPFDAALPALIAPYSTIDLAFVLDQHGTQISGTVYRDGTYEAEQYILLDAPAYGTDHTLKEYYYALLHSEATLFETLPSQSKHSGRVCVMVSTSFRRDGHMFILCLQLHVDNKGLTY